MKRKLTIRVLLVLTPIFLLISFGCKNKGSENNNLNNQEVEFNSKTPLEETSDKPDFIGAKILDIFNADYSDLKFKSIKLIPLETLPDVLIGSFTQLKTNFEKDDIYISNCGSENEIFHFNKEGKFLGKIGKHGGGPKEFSSIGSICIHSDTVDVLCDMGDKVKIVGYKNDDTFLYSKSINLKAYSFEWMSPGYIFETSYSAVHPFRVYTTDENGKITGSFLPNTTGFAVPIVGDHFSRLGSKVFFFEGFGNEAYIAEGSDFKTSYNLNFGSFKVPDEIYDKDPDQAFQLLMSKASAQIEKYFETPSYAFFQIRQATKPHSKLNDLIDYCIVHNKTNNKLMQRSFNLQSEDLFQHPVSGTLNNELVFLIYPYMLFNDEKVTKNLPIKNPEVIKKLKIDDNPVFAICKIE